MGLYDRTWKWFKAGMTIEEAKTLYRKLAMQYHPDHGGDATTFKEMMAEFEMALRFIVQEAFHKAGEEKTKDYSPHAFSDILSRIINFNVHIEIIGFWIYVFDSFAVKNELQKMGFWWASSKKAWVFSGGRKRRITPIYSVDGARKAHGYEVVRERGEQDQI